MNKALWTYNNKKIGSHDDLIPECTHIVYILHYEGDKKYIGKKTVRAIRRKKPTKAQLTKRKNYVRKEWVDLTFLNYEGSLDKKECPKLLRKEIIYQCTKGRTATYIETALLFEHDAVFSEEYLNKNILGKFFDNALEGILE